MPNLLVGATHRRFNPPTETILGVDGLCNDVVDLFTAQHRFVLKATSTAVVLFAAFSCLNNGGYDPRAYWSVVATLPNSKGITSGNIGRLCSSWPHVDTSNRAALEALIQALKLELWPLLGFRTVIVAINSQYVVDGFADHVDRWEKNGWKINSGKEASNQDKWEEVLKLVNFWDRCGVRVLLWNVTKATNGIANRMVRNAPVSGDSTRVIVRSHIRRLGGTTLTGPHVLRVCDNRLADSRLSIETDKCLQGLTSLDVRASPVPVVRPS